MELITFGETMAVMAPSSQGKLSDVASFSLRIAGAESNTAIGVARLGHSASWISAVGDDELGRYVCESIAREGVDVSHVRTDRAHRTGLMIKEIVEDTTTVYYYRENSATSHLSADGIPFEDLQEARILHLTGITPVLSETCEQTVLAALAWAKEQGILVSFDPNIRRKIWKGKDYTPLLRELLEASDIALLGLCEGYELYGTDSPEALAEHLLGEGVRYVAIKDGGRGAWCASGEEFVFIPPVACTSVDSVGAGDGFNAGFLCGLLEKKPLAEAGRMGAIVGAMATETVGDVNGYPTREQLNERLKRV